MVILCKLACFTHMPSNRCLLTIVTAFFEVKSWIRAFKLILHKRYKCKFRCHVTSKSMQYVSCFKFILILALFLYFKPESLNFHLVSGVNSIHKVKKTLKTFMHRKSKLNTHNKTLLYYACFRPLLTYAAPLWKKTVPKLI